MALGVRRRLFVVSMVLLGVVGVASGAYLEHRMRTWLEARVRARLLDDARAVAVAVANLPPGAERDRIIRSLADALEAEVEVFPETAPAGRSAQSGATTGSAREGGAVWRRRYNARRGTYDIVVSVPVEANTGRSAHGGDVRVQVARPLADVDEAVAALRSMMLVAAGLGLSVAAFMSWFASSLAAGALARLSRQAQRVLEAPGHARLPVRPEPELAGIATVVNQLAQRLREGGKEVERLRDEREAIVEASMDGIVVFDRKRRVLFVNDAGRRILGETGDREAVELVDLVRNPDILECAGQVLQGEAERTLGCEMPGGRHVLARLRGLRAGQGGVIVLRDISEVVRLERIRRDLVANVSHELRTPLSVIRANAEALADGALDDPNVVRSFLGAISRNVTRLADLVDDLLDLAKIEARSMRLETSARPVAAVVERAVEALAPLAKRRGQEVHLELDRTATARFDPAGLDRVVTNLVENALSYGRQGGNVWVRVASVGEAVELVVEDDGPGIPAVHGARVFERFYRVEDGRGRDQGGAGLGLSIVRNLVTAMGGEIRLESQAPSGARFVCRLEAGPTGDAGSHGP